MKIIDKQEFPLDGESFVHGSEIYLKIKFFPDDIVRIVFQQIMEIDFTDIDSFLEDILFPINIEGRFFDFTFHDFFTDSQMEKIYDYLSDEKNIEDENFETNIKNLLEKEITSHKIISLTYNV